MKNLIKMATICLYVILLFSICIVHADTESSDLHNAFGYLVFSNDGTFTAGLWDWDLDTPERKENAAEASRTWYVTAYNPFMNLYWDKPPYQLTLIYQNGRVITKGLTITDEGFSFTSEEGGGGYIPATEEEVQLTEDHG